MKKLLIILFSFIICLMLISPAKAIDAIPAPDVSHMNSRVLVSEQIGRLRIDGPLVSWLGSPPPDDSRPTLDDITFVRYRATIRQIKTTTQFIPPPDDGSEARSIKTLSIDIVPSSVRVYMCDSSGQCEWLPPPDDNCPAEVITIMLEDDQNITLPSAYPRGGLWKDVSMPPDPLEIPLP